MLPGQVIEILDPVHTTKGDEDRFFPAMVTNYLGGGRIELQWCQHTRSQYEIQASVGAKQRSHAASEPKLCSTVDLSTRKWRSVKFHSTGSVANETSSGYA